MGGCTLSTSADLERESQPIVQAVNEGKIVVGLSWKLDTPNGFQTYSVLEEDEYAQIASQITRIMKETMKELGRQSSKRDEQGAR